MRKKPDEKKMVTLEELSMARMIKLDTVTQLLIEKGVFSEEEFLTKLQQVADEYLEQESD